MAPYMIKASAAVFAILVLLLGTSDHVWAVNESTGLFSDFSGNSANNNPPASAPTVVRSRLVSVNFDLILGKDGSANALKVAETLNLNLFQDVAFIAVLDRLEKNPSGSYSWIGHLEGNPFGTVTLVVNDKIIMGNISSNDALYAVRFSGEFETHVIQEIDRAKFPRD